MSPSAPPKWYFKSREEGLARKLHENIRTHLFVGEKVMLSLVEIAPHTEGAIHSHPEEQWGYLLEGECVRIQYGEEIPMKAGDFWYTPADTPHGLRTGEHRAVVLDIFSPPRQAYTRPGEGLAAKEHREGK